MIYRYTLPRSVSLILSIIICIAGLLSPYYYAPFGIQWADEPYQIILAQNYMDAPMSFLSAYLAGLWGKCFGFGILTMRYYAVTVQMLAFAAICFYCWRRTRQTVMCLTFTGICAYLMNSKNTLYLIGWDATSTATIAFTTLAFIIYASKPSYKWLIGCGILSGMAVCTRVPNIVFIPAIFCLIALSTNKTTALKHCMVYLLVSVGTITALLVAFYGSPSGYLAAVKANTVSNHGIVEMVKNYINCGMIFLGTLALVYSGYRLILYVNTHNIYVKLFVGLVLLFYMRWFAVIYCSEPIFKVEVGLLILAFFFIMILLATNQIWATKWRNLPDSYKINTLQCAACLIACFIPIVGSNTGLSKAYHAMFMLPVMCVLWPQINRPKQTSLTIVMLIIATFVFLGRRNASFYDVGAKLAQYSPKTKLVSGVRTTESRAEALDNLQHVIETHKGESIIYFGLYTLVTDRFMGYYLSGVKPASDLHNWEVNEAQAVENAVKQLQRYRTQGTPVSIISYGNTSVGREEFTAQAPDTIQTYRGIVVYTYR